MTQVTSFESIQDHVSHVRQIFHSGKPRDLKWRKQQIQRLYDLVAENEERLIEAMYFDMNKPRNEALSGDIAPVLDECLYFLDVCVHKSLFFFLFFFSTYIQFYYRIWMHWPRMKTSSLD